MTRARNAKRLAGVVCIPLFLSQRVYINKREAKVGDGSLENERLELNKERGGKGKGGARISECSPG